MSRCTPLHLLACSILALILSPVAVRGENIAFKVKVPAGTPTDAKLYLAGDAKALGDWKADGLAMKRGEDGTYSAHVELPANQAIQYKVTRGSWETVEKNADGSEINNRGFTPTRDTTVEIEVAGWADTTKPAEKKSTRTGDIRTHPIHSKNLDNDRNLLVYLPPGYEQHADQRYPVLYMHDGQNVFDDITSFAGEWKADETAERLIKEAKIRPLIIVGIENNKWRADEYTMTRDERRGAGGRGAAYVKFVAEEVKPFIDATYRTRTDGESTGVGGSSLGGTISLEICRAYPQLFGRCAAISPALFWNDSELLKRFEKNSEWLKGERLWVDVGTSEGEATQHQAFVDGVRRLESIFVKSGMTAGKDYQLTVIPGAEHNEKAWSERFEKVLMFLYPA
jgi:predicted alpha/beta superfamily hydrolase